MVSSGILKRTLDVLTAILCDFFCNDVVFQSTQAIDIRVMD